MSPYDGTEGMNIHKLARSLDAITYQRICRLAGIPKDKIGYSLQQKEAVLNNMWLEIRKYKEMLRN